MQKKTLKSKTTKKKKKNDWKYKKNDEVINNKKLRKINEKSKMKQEINKNYLNNISFFQSISLPWSS